MRRSMVYIGHQGFSAIGETAGLIHIEPGGHLVFRGTARFGQGIRLWVDQGATLVIGDNFYCNKNCLLRAHDDITTGRDILCGWNVSVNTADGHIIYEDGIPKTSHGPIVFGNHIWIASHVIVGKGVVLSDDTVVAQCSTVTGVFRETNVLIGGTPARVLKNGIEWRE